MKRVLPKHVLTESEAERVLALPDVRDRSASAIGR